MAGKKILILFGSRYGSTEGIVKKMGEICKVKNINATIVNLKNTPKDKLPEIDDYNGIIIGSGIQVGQWTKEVKNFLVNNKDKLNVFKGPFTVFVSSGLASFPEQYEEMKNECLKQPLESIGIKTKNYEAFGGVFDLSENSKVPWLSRNVMKLIMGKYEKVNKSGNNDFRDWDKIQKYTDAFLERL